MSPDPSEDLDTISGHPLAWPIGWPRRTTRTRARFRVASMWAATRQVYAELKRLGVGDWNVVISSNVELRLDGHPRSNQRTPTDPGVAVYFRLEGERRVLACDAWDLPEHNLVAIAKHIEAVRGQARWGVGSVEQAFSAYRALPARGESSRAWAEVLGVSPHANAAEIRAAYVREVKRAHPDAGGSTERLQIVHGAWKQAQRDGVVA